jgi:hypothetical protein
MFQKVIPGDHIQVNANNYFWYFIHLSVCMNEWIKREAPEYFLSIELSEIL